MGTAIWLLQIGAAPDARRLSTRLSGRDVSQFDTVDDLTELMSTSPDAPGALLAHVNSNETASLTAVERLQPYFVVPEKGLIW